MGVGPELIIILLILGIGGFFVYWIIRRFGKNRRGDLNHAGRGQSMMRGLVIVAGLGLIVLLAVSVQFCSEQQTRMDKNTTRDNSVDNSGDDLNESPEQDKPEKDPDDSKK